MNKLIEQWKPKGIEALEPAALKALREQNSSSITAGPGAGKTEFLAQKASYQLELGICPSPFRLLAISFKKDAAENLAARVKQRCKAEYSTRFDSYTFDAFTKGIVDRFRRALPVDWRLPNNYEIVIITEREYQSFLAAVMNAYPDFRNSITAIGAAKFKNEILAEHKLSTESPTSLEERLARAWFKKLIKEGRVDFQFLNRLAEWIIRSAPAVRRAIRQTYPFVYIDEFQDTTFAQYDFLYSLLNSSETKVTVVGDDKQRIMAWAGAKPDAFSTFCSDFSASKFSLLMNYRSSPGLVAIQRHLALSLDSNCPEVSSGKEATISEEFAQVWAFTSLTNSYEYLASWISSDMHSRDLKPEDYAILVRQSADRLHTAMAPVFANQGLLLRNEARRHGKLSVSDITADGIFLFTSAILRLILQQKAPTAWTTAAQTLQYFFNDEGQGQNLEALLAKLTKPSEAFRSESAIEISVLITEILDSVGVERIKEAFPYHAHGDNFQIFVIAMKEYLLSSLKESGDWQHFLQLIDGENQIPLLTIHKSKGCEYDTVVLVGLDDDSWWSYSPLNLEGNATFFVALSRAKQRIIFTHAKAGRPHNQVTPLYELLEQAGVLEKHLDK